MAENDTTENIDTKETGANKKLIEKMRQRWKSCLEADEEQRRLAMDDMKFTVVPGYQWEDNQKKERGLRPCYEFNKIRVTAKRIINNMRLNRPSGKVRGTEDADKDTAEIYEGLIRNIWAQSKGDTVIDYAAEYQVIAGYGAWRLTTGYTSDDVFEQDVGIESIPNPFCLFPDPSDKSILKENARYWILTEKIPREEYESSYSGKEVLEWPSHEFDDEEDWSTETEEVRIAEYWYKEPITKELWQLHDGRVIDSTAEGADQIPPEMIKRTRTVDTHKIMMCIASGNAILEGPTEWAGSKFPFVPVYGEHYIVDGKVYWNGITRFAKDAQRSYNVSRTALTETIALAPLEFDWVTADQAEGHTESWQTAHTKAYPFRLFNADPANPGPPMKSGGPSIPVALIQESQMAAEEVNMVTGVYQADMGAPNQASSGVQEGMRQQAGHVATFNYQDNQASAIERTWELFVDLIPKVYDSERSLRVLGQDSIEDYVRINTGGVDENGQQIPAHDVTVGKYDVTISVGPNFTTKRQEAAETYQSLLQSSPEMFPIIGDLIFKSMDLPYSEEIAERLKVMAPPQIQELLNKDAQIPPEVQNMMQQAQQAMQVVEQQMQVVQEEANKAEVDKAGVEKLIAKLEAEQANFEATVAKEMAGLVKMEAKLVQKDAQTTVREIELNNNGVLEEERATASEQLAAQMAAAILEIQEVAAQFTAKAVNTMDAIRETTEKRPKISKVVAKRENGQLVAVPEYEDDPTIQ